MPSTKTPLETWRIHTQDEQVVERVMQLYTAGYTLKQTNAQLLIDGLEPKTGRGLEAGHGGQHHCAGTAEATIV